MNCTEIVEELSKLGSLNIKTILLRHGAQEPIFGVKVGDLKKLQKKLKVNHPLALELYDTGISDAMYLAGLICDPKRMTREELHRWQECASWSMISNCTVAWVASESPHALELGLQWIDSKQANIASSGWCTLGSWISIRPDSELPLKQLQKLLRRVEKGIHQSPNAVRSSMNHYVICCGAYVLALTEEALAVAGRIGQVEFDSGETSCKLPDAVTYLEKIKSMGRLGKKKKQARC